VDLRALLFDINGTLIDIETDEHRDDVYRGLGRVLTFQGVYVSWRSLRDLYFQTVKDHLQHSSETHPDVDVVAVWRDIVERNASPETRGLPAEKLRQLPLFLAETQRALSRLRLRLFPDVLAVLERLRPRYRLGIVSDHQTPYGLAELRTVGLADYFDPVVISADHGFRKPDVRLFRYALKGAQARPEEAIFIGNDLYHDVAGAHGAGMKCVFFSSGAVKHHPLSTTADYVIHRFAQLPEAIQYLAARP
jgi:putative hydrolase of the HAD superfamily